MERDFLHCPLGKLQTPVFRVGLSATYRPGRKVLHKALDEGLNYLFFFGIDTQMVGLVRETISKRREQYVLATGAYNFIFGAQDLVKTLEKRLKRTGAGYIDVFHFLGVTKPSEFTPKVREQLQQVRESGLVRGVSISTHDRKFAAQLANEGVLDAMMIRYNAAHRGAETDIFPHLPATNPAVVSFTATRWRSLLRRPKSYPKGARVPTAADCYRFVLSNPNVHVAMMAPSNIRQLEANLEGIRKGPMEAEEMQFMRSFGDEVYRDYKYFR